MTSSPKPPSLSGILAGWKPPEPIFLLSVDLDALLDGVAVKPWLLAFVRCCTQPSHPSQPGCFPVSCATAIGRLARLWSPADPAQIPAIIASLLDGQPGIALRCAAWARSLTAAQSGFILRCALNHVDDLYDVLSWALRGDDRINSLAERRDDLESLLWVLRQGQVEDADLLAGSLASFDEHARARRAAIEALTWQDDDLLAEVACNEPTQWWGHIEGVEHVWGVDDLLR
jgi:hypothetical protein